MVSRSASAILVVCPSRTAEGVESLCGARKYLLSGRYEAATCSKTSIPAEECLVSEEGLNPTENLTTVVF